MTFKRKFKQFQGTNYDNLKLANIDYKILSDFQSYLINGAFNDR
ncbi:MAG: hypothetical protein K9J13_11710 [Saprospiraceae bacterium]|nr:hypothetical protein [Saprospiraceae bacterium]